MSGANRNNRANQLPFQVNLLSQGIDMTDKCIGMDE
jgi:hypothetical protein